MPTTTIFCPACNHKLRVPDELMAQPVECPKCGVTFTAPPPASAAPPDDRASHGEGQPVRVGPIRAEGNEDDGRGQYDDWDEGPRQPLPQANPGKVTAPGIALLLTAILHLGMNAFGIINAIANPDDLRNAMKQVSQVTGMAPAPFDVVKISVVAAGGFILVSLAQIAGAAAMLRRRGYALAMMGAILSIINCNQVCCLLSIPVGIWAFFVLLQPDVKASFS